MARANADGRSQSNLQRKGSHGGMRECIGEGSWHDAVAGKGHGEGSMRACAIGDCSQLDAVDKPDDLTGRIS